MKVFLTPALVAAVQISSPGHPDADQLRETFYSLAAAKAKNGGKVDPDTQNIVKKILEDIDDKLMAALWEDRDQYQSDYDAYFNAIGEANNIPPLYCPEAGGEYSQCQRNTEEKRLKWKECINGHADDCRDCNLQCGWLDDYIKDWPTCDAGLLETRSCTAGGDGACSDESCDPLPNRTDLYNTLDCLVEFDKKHYQTFMDAWKECDTCKHGLIRTKLTCEMEQEEFERAKCNEQQCIHEACDNYHNDYNIKVSTYNKKLEELNRLEEINQKQYTALQCLKCYGYQVLADETDLSVCENGDMPVFECNRGSRQVEPTVALALCPGSVPPPLPCLDDVDTCVPGPDEPGTDCFENEHYDPYDVKFGLPWVCPDIADRCIAPTCIYSCAEKYGPDGAAFRDGPVVLR